MKRHLIHSTVIATISLLTACGGGGGGGSTSGSSVTNASPGGIWRGRDPQTNQEILGLIAEDGRTQFVVFDGIPPTQYFGRLSTSGNSLSGEVNVADELTFFGTASVTGTVTPRQQLATTLRFTPFPSGATQTVSVTLTFDTLYNRPSSLSKVTGNWRDITTGVIYNVNASGVVFAQDPSTGCVINGTVSLINTSYNAYAVQYSYSACRGALSIYNGTTGSGLAALDDTVTPNRLAFGVQYRQGNLSYAIYSEAAKT